MAILGIQDIKAYYSGYLKSVIPRSIPSMYLATVNRYLSSVATHQYLWPVLVEIVFALRAGEPQQRDSN